MNRVGIIGIGQSVHGPSRPDVDYAELVLESIDEALDDAGIGLGDLDNAVTAAMDFWDGRTIANMSTAEVVGSYLKSESRLCADGISALIYGWTRIADGEFSLGLIAAHCKESGGNLHDIESAAFDPFTQRRLELDGDVLAGLQAQRLFAKNPGARTEATAAVVAACAASQGHPKLTPRPLLTDEEVAEGPPLATPLTVHDKAPVTDGSAALVIASEAAAGRLGVEPVWITGLSTITGRYWSERDLLDVSALVTAVARVRTMAGWGDAAPDILEFGTHYSHHAPMFRPAFGAGPDTAVNRSGGWLAGNPYIVSGLSRVVEAVHQLRGTAGDRQAPGASTALAHGTTGLAAQSHSVVALEGPTR